MRKIHIIMFGGQFVMNLVFSLKSLCKVHAEGFFFIFLA
jgi:hypothetical protein